MTTLKSLRWGWAVAWAAWSVLTVAFVGVKILPALVDFMDLADRHPSMMLTWRGIGVFAALGGWFVLGLLALVYLQAFWRKCSEALER